jgi:Bifunctional DNA primase/polymerase, N-terminal
MVSTNIEQNTLAESADFWRYDIGVNVIPADTKNKTTTVRWSEYQDTPISKWRHEQWKKEGAFNKGIAIIPGRVWHREDKRGFYFIFLDADKRQTIDELCTRNVKTITLQEMANKFLVEQHEDNLEKAHIYFYSPIPFPKKSADSVLGLEVKGLGEHGIAFCFPSIHKDGKPYEIIGTNQPVVLTQDQAMEMIQHLNQICMKRGLEYLGKDYSINNIQYKLKKMIKDLVIDTAVKIPQGQRHKTLISMADSLLFNHLSKDKNKRSEKWLKDFFKKINFQLCEPEPLPESELNGIWNSALDFVLRIRKEEKKEVEDEDNDGVDVLELVKRNCSEFFLDQYNSSYAAFRVNQHTEIMSMQSRRFRNWVCKTYYENTGEPPSAEELAGTLNILKANAEFGGKERELHLRIAPVPNSYSIYYDLTNKEWEAIRISENGWSIEKLPPIIFRRYTNQQAQVYPTRDYPPDIFDQFINLLNVIDEDNKLLLKCYIIALFIPEIPKPILMLHGEQGSAKSTLSELIKMLVDPSIIRTLAFSKDNSELIQKLSHNYLSYFDNISNISDWISDQLCRAVTGSGFSKRELYTDDDDIIYNFKRCIGFNGINLAASKPDLLDRGLIIKLERIVEERMRKIEDVWADFEKLRPQLLGYIFDILVKVMQKKNEGGIDLKMYPRMADFAEIAEIICRCMGYPENRFLDAYYRDIGLQTKQALEASPVATTIIEFMHSRTHWTGTATELLEELEYAAEILKIKTKNNRTWPTAPNRLSRKLNEIKTNLRQIGIVVERHTDSRTNMRKIEIRKVSYVSPVSPVAENQARFDLEYSGDNNTVPLDVSPAACHENHVQNDSTGDPYDPYDTLPTTSSSNYSGAEL